MDSHTTEHLAGGAIRVSVNSATSDEALQAHHETNRVHRGVVREDGSGQHVQHSMETPQYAGSVMATLRNSAGGQRIDPTATVDVGGMRTSLRNAVELGYLVETGPGQYADAPQRPEEQSQGHQQDTGSAPELAPPAEEAAFGEVIAELRQDSYDSAAAFAATAVVDQTNDTWLALADRLAKSEGIDPDVAAEKVEQAHAFFTKQVDRVCEGLGISDPEPFYSWLQEKRPRELTAATQALVGLRNTGQFRELAVEWKVQAGTAQLAKFRSMGVDAYVDRASGEVMVSRDGGRPVRARDLGNA